LAKQVLVIGAGLGGLATALRLTTAGYQVQIVEKHHQAGGRLNQLKSEGFTFDVGPSFFSMSYEFEELYRSAGMANPIELRSLDPCYVVHFRKHAKPFRIYRDLSKLAQEFADFEPDFEAKMERYLAKAGQIFHDTEHRIVKRNFTGVLDHFWALSQVPWKHAPMMFRSMWSELDKHFSSEEVKVIFSLVAFFLGSTPFDTPAVYSLLNYTELKHDGYWNVGGGMYRIVETLVEELKKRGVDFHFNTEIVSVQQSNGQITSVTDAEGKQWKADLYVCNGDAAWFRGKILQRPQYTEAKLDALHWTLAPFTMYLGVKGKIDGLAHHSYFLGDNFNEYASDIFKTSIAPDKPYYYVNVSSKSNPGSAPEGCENLFILCPVPDLRYKPDWSDTNALADTIIDDLGQRVGYDIRSNLLTKTILNPIDWRDKFNLYKGSGLGLAHDLGQIGGLRPRNKDESLKNLYYVGASTIPGTGLPIVVIGSKLVTERILKDHAAV